MIEKEVLRRYNIHPKKYSKRGSSVIIETKDDALVLKRRKNNDKVFDYLRTRNFNSFPNSYHFDDDYDIFEYQEDYDISDEERSYDLINLVSLLHMKTTHYKNIDIDDLKIIYEKIDKKLDELNVYYTNLNDLIDKEIYMSPASYLLARNISEVYVLLSFCKNELDAWYELVKNKKKQRVALVHNNLRLDHLIRNERSFLISWDRANFDFPEYDLVNFYRNNYSKINFDILLKSYESKYPLLEDERKFLFLLISIPEKIEFSNNSYNDTKKVKQFLDYIYRTNEIISPYYSEEQEVK